MQPVILAMIWWKWLLLVLAVFAGFGWLSLKSYRRSIREHLIRYLHETHPELKLVSKHSNHLIFRTEKTESCQMNLHNLFLQIANARTRTPEDERAIFKTFVGGLMENLERATRPISIESDGDFLLPRLVNKADLSQLVAQSKVIHQPLADTGLHVVYVRDSADAVSYLSEQVLPELQLDVSALHERALANLRKKNGQDFARKVLSEKSLVVFKLGDTFDAVRLLLVPEQLKEGEALAAAIPDRDTLAMSPPPDNGDWNGFTKLSRASAGPPLLNRPLKVTRSGFELMGG